MSPPQPFARVAKTILLGPPTDSSRTRERLKKIPHYVLEFGTCREDTIARIAQATREHGPFAACMITAANPLIQTHLVPTDAALLSPLAPECKFYTGPGAGHDKFDKKWASSYGASYFNSPLAVAEPTATTAVLLVLSVLRGAMANDRAVRSGKWKAGEITGREPSGLVLGLIGLGSIAKIVAARLACFGMKIHYHARRPVPGAEVLGYVHHETLESLLRETDVLSIHCPLTPQTHHLINTKTLGLMKRGSFLINTARGDILDETALLLTLDEGHILRAGLDVFSNEPEVNPLICSHPSITLSPHNGPMVSGVVEAMESEMFDDLEVWLADIGGKDPMLNCVSGPRSVNRM